VEVQSIAISVFVSMSLFTYVCLQALSQQEALLLQRDHATRLLVEILQLRIIPFEKKDYKR